MLPSALRCAALTVALLLLTASAATGQGREFAGEVVSVSGGALVVVDRRGERLGFQRDAKTRVQGKEGWDALAPGDRVIVQWSLGDGPPRARRVIVLGSGR